MTLEKIAENRMYIQNPATLSRIINPRTGRQFEPIEISCLDDKVENAERAYKLWSCLKRERQLFFETLSELLYRNSSIIASIITQESGKPLSESYVEVMETLEALKYFPKEAKKVLAPKRIRLSCFSINGNKRCYRIYKPKGIIAIISPWNYPLKMPAVQAIQVLSAGNAAIIKPASHTPYSMVVFEELVNEAWRKLFRSPPIPPEPVQFAYGCGSFAGRRLVEYIKGGRIHDIVFTGSYAVGKRIASELGEYFKRPIFELGGKDIAIVFNDADIAKAAKAIVCGAFYTSGQNCCSTELCFVERDVAERFIDEVLNRTSKLIVGNGLDPATDIGPLISEQQLDWVFGLIDDALKRGAKLLCGGKRIELPGYFLEPTVLLNVPHDARILKEEIFGPVLPIQVVDSRWQALDYAKGSQYGLTASVFTRNIEAGAELIKQLDVGIGYVNDLLWGAAEPRLPWHGQRKSGVGMTKGKEGLLESSKEQIVILNPGTALCDYNNPWQDKNSLEKMKLYVSSLGLYTKNILTRLRAVIGTVPKLVRYLFR